MLQRGLQRDGVLSEEVYEQLVAEIDAGLLADGGAGGKPAAGS